MASDAQTTRAAREAAAEALWQAESVRASGAMRRTAWVDEGEDVHAKWLFMADAAIVAFLRHLPEWPAHMGMPSQESGQRLAREIEAVAKEANRG